jgi:Aerotolerance regulator N-terminal
MAWLAQYFLNPAFVVPGFALASVPIIIHILSRLRYRKVRFAAMEFLLQSEELNRRRLVLEQLLLLLLRILIILLITMLLARMVLDPSRLLMLRGASVHHVIILDDTLSLRDRTDGDILFDKALQTLEQMLIQSGQQAGASRLTLLLSTDPARPVVTDRIIYGATLQDILPRVRNLTCSQRSATISDAIDAAYDILSADGGVAPQLHIITDLRTSDWLNRPEVTAALEELKSISANVNIVRIAEETHPNVSIEQLTSDTRAVARGIPWRLDLSLHNFGEQTASGLRASVLVDGSPLPVNILIPPIDAGSRLVVSHDIAFRSEGRHQVLVKLDDDSLLEDNRRFIIVEVTDRRTVLIVDDEGRQQDAGFLAAALAADGELTGLSADIRTSGVLTQQNLADYDCICLLNIRDLPADATQQLRDYVVNGGGIAWFPDDQANISWYSDTLGSTTTALFPVPLSTIRESPAVDGDLTYQNPVFMPHPIFAVYNVPDSPFSSTLLISRWFGLSDSWDTDDAARADGVTTLARLENGDPVAFEQSLGDGKILTFLFGAGRRWSNWPVAPAAPGYVVTHLLMHKYLQRTSDDLQSRELNEPLTMQWPVDQFGANVEVFLPDPAETEATADETFVRLQATTVSSDEFSDDSEPDRNQTNANSQPDGLDGDADQFFAINIPQADRPGVYRVRRFDSEGTSNETWLGVNIAPGESDLTVADDQQLAPLTSIDGVRILDAAAADSLGTNETGREIRWMLLALVIVILVAEQLLSLKMSYHPGAKQ